MQMQQVNFTGNGNRRSFLGDVGASVANVAFTVGAGATVGSLGGRIATLVPYKIKDADMAFQYSDMFTRAANNETLPKIYNSASEQIKQYIEMGRNCLDMRGHYAEQVGKIETFAQEMAEVTDAAFSGTDIQDKIKRFLGDAADKVPTGGYTKQNLGERLVEMRETALNSHSGYGEYFKSLRNDFVEAVKNAKDTTIDEVAKKGAKALRNRTIIGAGIAIGVIGALVLNIMKSAKNTKRVIEQQNQAE